MSKVDNKTLQIMRTPCEVCGQTIPLYHPCGRQKNGYCSVFKIQALQDAHEAGMHTPKHQK